MKTRLFQVLTFSLFLTVSVFGQQPYFKNYRSEHGLPSSLVYEVFQDSKGYIWMATDVGVSRFDGYTFEIFTTENGLADNEVFNFFEDSQGRIWFHTFNGRISYFQNEQFYNSGSDAALRGESFGSYISGICEDAQQNIYISSVNNGLRVISRKGENQHYYFDEGMLASVWVNPAGELQMGSSQGIYEFDENGLTRQLLPFHKYRSTRYYRFDDLIIVGLEDFVYFFDTRRKQLVRTIEVKEITTEIIRVYWSDNQLWLGTRNGVLKLEFEDDNFEQYHLTRYLEGKSVTSILKDRESNLWFSTLESGVFLAPSPAVLHYTVEDGLPHHRILCLKKDFEERLWIGSIKNQYAILEGNEFTNYKMDIFIKAPISAFDHVSSNESWIIGRGGSIRMLNNIPHYFVRSSGSILLDKDDYYWLGHWTTSRVPAVELESRLITELNPGMDKVLRRMLGSPLVIKEQPINENRTTSLVEAENKTIWVGTLQGLFWYRYDKDKIVVYSQSPLLPYKINKLVFQKKEQLVWVGSDSEGVFAVSGDSVVQRINKDFGLSSNICTALKIDEEENIWVGTANGLNKIIKTGNQYKVINLSEISGLRDIKVNDIEIVGDQIYLATDNGITVLPYDISNQKSPPPIIYLKDFEVNNEQQNLADEAANLEEGQIYNHTQNFMKFHFLGLSFKDQGEVRYKYRLIGQDEDWEYSSTNTVDYRSLPPGDYQFEVKAINGSGVESLKAQRVSFRIDAPFWRKPWFILFAIAAVLFGFFAFSKNREAVLKRKFTLEQRVVEAENEKLEYEKDFAELEMRALRMQMNPHFLFNALNTIKGYYADARVREANSYISKFARLLRLILENAEKYIPLEKEIQILRFYLDLSQDRYPGKFDYELKIGKGIHVSDVAIPPMLLQPFVENAIVHGLAPIEMGGKITIAFEIEKNTLISSVTDSGVGRVASSKHNKRIDHQSKSIQITSERLKIINKGHSIRQAFLIEDLVDPNGDPAGTRIVIRTPLKRLW